MIWIAANLARHFIQLAGKKFLRNKAIFLRNVPDFILRSRCELLPAAPMKQTYSIDSTRSLVEITYHARPTYEEWVQTMREIFADARFRPGFHFLFDKEKLVEATSNEYVEAVAQFISRHSGEIGRCAILVQGALTFGMARMTEAYSRRDDVRAFMDREAALAWLLPRDGGAGSHEP